MHLEHDSEWLGPDDNFHWNLCNSCAHELVLEMWKKLEAVANIVTTAHESKEAFIGRVRSVLWANRMDSRPMNTIAVQGAITFGELTLEYDAFEHTQDGELVGGSIQIMRWKMAGEKWSDDQLRKVYCAVNAALQESDLSVETLIAEAHTARRWAKTLAGE